MAGAGFDGGVDWNPPGDIVARIRLFEAFANFGVVGFPDDGAGGDGFQIQCAGAEGQFEQLSAGAFGEDFVDAAPLLFFGGAASIEDQAVAGFERRVGWVDGHPAIGTETIKLHEDASFGDA